MDFTSLESQTPECSAVWVLQATESRRVEVSPTEALAGIEGPRGQSEEVLKGRGGVCDAVSCKRVA